MQKYTTGIRNLDFTEYKNIDVHSPPLPEQRRIVELLDSAFEKIAAMKRNAETSLQNAKVFFESYLQTVFEKKDETWETRSLMEVADVSTGKRDANHATENGKYRFYTCALEHFHCDTNRFSGECLILPGNGVHVGKVFYYDGAFDAYQRTYVISNITLLPRYLHYHMLLHWKSTGTQKQYGSATNFIRIGNFQDYKIEYPPTKEQRRIVHHLDSLSAHCQKLQTNYSRIIADCDEIKKSILSQAFSGEM